MTEPQFDALDKIFREVQVDLPPRLQARLLVVPHMAPAIPFWEPEWMLPATGVFLGSLWWALRHASTIYQQVAILFKGLPLPSLEVTMPSLVWTLPTVPEIAPIFVVAGAGAVALTIGLGAWLYLQAEEQIDLRYIQSLSRHI